ncbi:MAG: hypothetical protein FJ278_21310, partial [Planctomycetes bacterium]|nr:hypothetical protein [Planctomycetota bacterium]
MKVTLLLCMFAGLTCAKALAADGPLSVLPIDVVLDYNYGTGHLHNGTGAPLYPLNPDYWPRFIAELRRTPPQVLIVGKEAPFTHSLGPIASYGGENQTFPAIGGKDGRYRLTPDQTRQRIAAIRKFVDEVHAAGVPKVMPYVSLITMFGEPEKRIGFWEFYDHWDEYAKDFDLGPRPEGDPLDWAQRDKEGKTYFKWGPDKPHYKPFRRFTVCVNHPGWRAWCHAFTRWIARVGYDGLWIDNAVEQRCYCRYCKAEGERIGQPLVPQQFGDLAQRAAQRVWLESHLRLWDELRKEGERIRPGFGIYVNYIEIPDNVAVTSHADL